MKKVFLMFFAVTIALMSNNAFAQSYSDLDKSHWAYDKIEALTEDEVLAGYPDGTFRANEKVTRAEFATMVIMGLHQENAKLDNIIKFKDLPKNHWAYNTVERAVRFDLIKGTPEGLFYPNEPVTRAHAISVAVNALDTRSISEKKAREVLKKAYNDYDAIPNWVVINAGKAEILGMNVKVPGYIDFFDAEKPATRAEAAVAVYNMVEQAKRNPNQKLAEAMRPPLGEGIIVSSAIYENSVITIPAGTKLPVVLIDGVSSQKTKVGELFMAKVPQNYLTKDRYIIIVENSPIAGQVLEVKAGHYFLRNGKITMETRTIKTLNKNQEAYFKGICDTKIKRKFWAKIGRALFKGAKINIKDGEVVNVELLKPLRIDAVTGKIMK